MTKLTTIRGLGLVALVATQIALAGGSETPRSGRAPASRPAPTAPAPAQECPAGTHEWVDSRGEPTCERLEGGPSTRVGAIDCPRGSRETVDAWGERHCKVI